MEIIKSKIDRDKLNNNINISKETCFFDIETTGFNRSTDIIYLIGILYFDKEEDSWTLAQYFANDLKDEPELIIEATKLLMNFDTIVNYNGNSFDIPFVNHKLKTFKSGLSIDKDLSLDLYSIIRKNNKILNLESMKLKAVERYLGVFRDDIYSGKDCIDFYKDYILKGDQELKNRLLNHNFEDLYFLIDIMDIIDIIKSKSSFKLTRANKTIDFSLEDIKQYKDSMVFNGKIKGLNQKFIYYSSLFDILIEDTNRFEIRIYTANALVSPDEVAVYIDKDKFDLSVFLETNHTYKIPDNILLLKVESNYLYDDILIFLKEILDNII